MAGLRAVHRREEQSAHHAAQVGDPLLVDCRQRSQRQPAQVEVGASLSLILEAFGCGGAQRGAGRLIEQRVLGGEGGGHGRNSYTNPYAARSILYPFLFLKHPPSGGCSADCGASWSFRKMAREPYGRRGTPRNADKYFCFISVHRRSSAANNAFPAPARPRPTPLPRYHRENGFSIASARRGIAFALPRANGA